MYLTSFTLPISMEEILYKQQAAKNGGKYGYVDNPTPADCLGSGSCMKWISTGSPSFTAATAPAKALC